MGQADKGTRRGPTPGKVFYRDAVNGITVRGSDFRDYEICVNGVAVLCGDDLTLAVTTAQGDPARVLAAAEARRNSDAALRRG